MANNDTSDRLPIFWNDKDKDTLTPEDWANRAITQQQSMYLPNRKAVNECRLALQGLALEWYSSLGLKKAHLYQNFKFKPSSTDAEGAATRIN